MNIWIITGGCGFVGSNLAASLLADGVDVVVLDSLYRLGSDANLRWLRERAAQPNAGKFTFVRADTRSWTDVEHAFAKLRGEAYAVAHLAGQVAMTTSLERPRFDFETNALGALNVLEALRLYQPNAVALFSSTNKVYGDLETIQYEETPTRWTAPAFARGFDESLPLAFASPYGCSKGAADQYFLDYCKMYGLRTIVFRHSSIYGGRQYASYDQGWVGWFCAQILRQGRERERGLQPEPFTVSGDGKQVRDLLHAEDIVSCYRMAAEAAHRDAARCVGRPYNIGGGAANSLSLRELFREIGELTGHDARYVQIAPRHSDQRVFIADNQRATASFGWKPTVDKREGLSRMLRWVAEMGEQP